MELISELTARGYAQFHDVHCLEHALSATESLGPLLPLNGQRVQRLVPKEIEETQSNSFSRRHGRNAFPLHTDTAFWAEPARFIVLFSSVMSHSATRVLSANDTNDLIASARRNNPVFLRSTIKGAVYSHPWGDTTEFNALYDPCCMRAVNAAALEFEEATLKAGERSHRLCWRGNTALVIDNWRVMHGRESCTDDNRLLYRFYRGTNR